jgi:hypothetical protein
MDAAPRILWKTLDVLEASLRDFQRMYEEQPVRRSELRHAVIKAKDRARFASRNPKVSSEKRAEKDEMVRWMLVWLDDPSMFADWVTLRRPLCDRL